MVTTIFEPIYQAGQVLSEPAFSELKLPDNSHAAWREVRILVDFYRRGDHRRPGFTGIFSPKFGLKTKVSAENFLEFTSKRGEADVCIINAFPTLAYYSFNVWMQGELNHPGLIAVSQQLLDACGINWDLSATPRQSNAVLCYSNFWAGTEKFWDEYIGGVIEPIAAYLEANPAGEVTRAVMGDTWHTEAAPYLPFIVERLFSTFLSFRKELTVAAYPIADVDSYAMNDFELDVVSYMRPAIEEADASDDFPDSLRELQGLMCKLGVRYAQAYFAQNAHPHTGKLVS